MAKKGKYIVILIFMLITTSIITYIYSNRIENTIAESSFPSNVIYNFEEDEIGTHPAGWSGGSWSGTEVIAWEKDKSYGQVAEVENRDGDGVELATRFKKAKSGVIEFDIYCDYDKRISIDITQMTSEHDPVDDIIIHLGGSDSAIKIKDGNDNFVKLQSFSVEKWYHFKIEFNMDYWELWIDREQVLLYSNPHIDYYELPPYFCELYFSTYVADNGFYVDNVEITVIEAL